MTKKSKRSIVMTMSEQFGEVRSLTQLENWGGDYPGEHLFSTLANMDNSDGRLDEAMQVVNILTKKMGIT